MELASGGGLVGEGGWTPAQVVRWGGSGFLADSSKRGGGLGAALGFRAQVHTHPPAL